MFTADRQRVLNYLNHLETYSQESVPVCPCMEQLERIPVPRGIKQLEQMLKTQATTAVHVAMIPILKTTNPMLSMALFYSCRDRPPLD